MIECGLPQYAGNEYVQCIEEPVDILEVEIEDKTLCIPICKYHSNTWEIIFGHKWLAALIRDNKVKGEWKDA